MFNTMLGMQKVLNKYHYKCNIIDLISLLNLGFVGETAEDSGQVWGH